MTDTNWDVLDSLREKLGKGFVKRHQHVSKNAAVFEQKPYNDEAAAELNAKMFEIAEHGSVCYGRA
jgi:hypothetical protein